MPDKQQQPTTPAVSPAKTTTPTPSPKVQPRGNAAAVERLTALNSQRPGSAEAKRPPPDLSALKRLGYTVYPIDKVDVLYSAAKTWWPRSSAASASARPRPRLAPVMRMRRISYAYRGEALWPRAFRRKLRAARGRRSGTCGRCCRTSSATGRGSLGRRGFLEILRSAPSRWRRREQAASAGGCPDVRGRVGMPVDLRFSLKFTVLLSGNGPDQGCGGLAAFVKREDTLLRVSRRRGGSGVLG